VVELLTQRNISLTSVDFVRFTWLNKQPDHEIVSEDDDDNDAKEEEEEDYDDIPHIKPVEDGVRYYTNPTIWVGVVPGTLTGALAHESASDILAYLNGLEVQNIDIAYRESIFSSLRAHGPALYPPVEDGDDLKDIIDNVSVALSLPIAGLKTTMQGTLGPYFHVGKKLYAITARHNLFLLNDDNAEFMHKGNVYLITWQSKSFLTLRSRPPSDSAPKKKVLVMGKPAFTNYLASIQALIGTLIDSTEYIQRTNTTFRNRVEAGTNVQESQAKLDENEAELLKTRRKIDKLKKFFVDIKKRWSKRKDRVIGFVAWAPPIGVGVAPHRYTRDLCVVELYKDKFKDMIGNVLSLGAVLVYSH